jgi:CubicO group peptidase (beta-lactamase class C family)
MHSSLRSLVVALALAPPLLAGPPPDAELAASLKAHLDALSAADGFSGAVLVARGDQVLFREAYGLASREARTPNRPETRFNLGSINKAFTRLAIEQLAAAGRLSLGDTLDRYVPEYPVEKGRRITLQQLLEHRGGTGDVFGPRYDRCDRARLRTLRDWLPLFAEEPLLFDPGTQEKYSNAGYVLLGLVVEKVSGRSYDDYVGEHVFAPAGMKDTGAYPVEGGVANTATGYTRGPGGGLQDNGSTLPWRGSSAGGGYSTADDLLRFAQALRGGRLGPAVGALGIAGGAPGINAALEMMGDYTVVVLANLDPPAVRPVVSKLRDWLGQAEGPGGPRRVLRRSGEGPGSDGRPPGSSLPAGGVDVPMLRSGHLPAVQVRVNGQGPFLFAIDTGGAGTARVDTALAARLGLSRIGEALQGDPSGTNTRTVPVVALDSIEIGGARFTGLSASVRDYNEQGRTERVDGVIGFGLFAECVFTLDYPASRVRLRQGELPAVNGQDVLAYQERHGVPSVALQVAGREFQADVDAGSMGGVTLPESAAASLPLASAPQVVGRARTVSNTFEIKAAELDGDVLIGGYRLVRPRVEFQPLFPMANIGSRVLRDLVVSFDQKNRRLQLTRPAASGAAQAK